eukprot:Sdes_comp21635_c0_seq1m20223
MDSKMDSKKVSSNFSNIMLKNAYSEGPLVTAQSLCSEGTVVFYLLRRFGCSLCRHAASVFSTYADDFRKLNISVVGIAFDSEGLDEFKEGNFWSWPLYMDESKSLYQEFGCKRNSAKNAYGMLSLGFFKGLWSAKTSGFKGNVKGDGFQMGGTFIVDQNGNILFAHVQQNYGDHVDAVHVLKALGVSCSAVHEPVSASTKTCEDEKCTR